MNKTQKFGSECLFLRTNPINQPGARVNIQTGGTQQTFPTILPSFLLTFTHRAWLLAY